MNETVVQIPSGGANVFLLRGDGGNVLVDAGMPGRAGFILQKLAELGIAPGDIRLILITHGHVDHFGSAAALHEHSGASVGIHVHDADALRHGIHSPDSLHPTNWWVAVGMRLPFLRVPGQATPYEPDVLFEDEARLDGYGVAGRVIPTPGHTPGAISVLLDNGAAIVGDMVMGQLMGWVRRPGKPLVAWDLDKNRESLARLLAFSPRIVYTGHGGPFEPPFTIP